MTSKAETGGLGGDVLRFSLAIFSTNLLVL